MPDAAWLSGWLAGGLAAAYFITAKSVASHSVTRSTAPNSQSDFNVDLKAR
jgi:hypothetical protein